MKDGAIFSADGQLWCPWAADPGGRGCHDRHSGRRADFDPPRHQGSRRAARWDRTLQRALAGALEAAGAADAADAERRLAQRTALEQRLAQARRALDLYAPADPELGLAAGARRWQPCRRCFSGGLRRNSPNWT